MKLKIIQIISLSISLLKTFIRKGKRAKSSFRRACVLAVWLGQMFIGTNVALLGVQTAQASTTLYDVQFNLYSQDQQTGAAIIGQAGDYWNRLAAASGTSALADTAGNMNGVSFAWAGTGLLVSGIANPSFGNGDSNLMDCYIFYSSSSGSQNMTFSNLTANAPFTLYIYTQGDSATTGRKLSVTFNGSTYTAAAAVAGTTSFVSGQNYLTISGTTTAGGTLPFSYSYAAGEADINGIQLSVANSAPAITTQPASQTMAVGGTVNLSVTASGNAPFYYQWFKNGGMVLGATNSVLIFSSAGVTNSGVYYVVITNSVGLCISQPAAVTVGAPQLLAWGLNDSGQLGDGTTTNRNHPGFMATNVVAAAAGYVHSLYLTSDGTLWGAGQNYDGDLGNGTRNQLDQVCIASNVVATAAGAMYSLYLKGDGTLWAMGFNNCGQLGDGTTNNRSLPAVVASNVVAMAAGETHSLFVKSDGTLWAMGENNYGDLGDGTTNNRSLPESVASNVVAAAAGWGHSLFLKSDGTLWAMGYNSGGQLGDGTLTNKYSPESVASNVTAVAAGTFYSMYLKNDGVLWAMGDNQYGQLGNGLANALLPVSIASNVMVMAAGEYHSLYLKNDGTLWAMGDNQYGQLGDGTIISRSTAVPVTGMSLANVISGSTAFHTLAVGVPLPPAITSQPTNQSVVVGGNVTFTVTASGFAPLSYQWQFNGTNILSATNTSYVIASAALNDTGDYAVIVTNNFGSTISLTATLTVTNQPPPTATVTGTAAPTNAGSVAGGGVYIVGSNAVLTATSSNNWKFINWNNGTTNNPYVITVPATNITFTAQFAATATITVSANPNSGGSVTGSGTFLVGSTNLISAVASNGWIFAGWSDTTSINPYSITVASNLTLTANFAPAVTVTTVALPPEGGLTTGDGTYAIGSSATVTATATNGWAFLSWNGAVTNNPWTFLVPSNATVCTATFAQVSTVTGLANPTNAGSVAGGGVYIIGSNAVLSATASNNWQFINWNDGTTNNPYVITVPATNITYTAQFAATATITVSANPNSGGSVTGGGTFLVGSTNLISAVASNGWIFAGWSDTTSINPYSITVASNLTLTANFMPAATVTIIINPTNAVAGVTGGGICLVGSNAVLTATASNGWVFLNWNGTVTNYTQTGNTNNPLEFTVTSNVTVTANFAQVENGFVYTVINPKGTLQAEIIGYNGPTTGTITVPSVIGGLAVTVIGTGAFWWDTFSKIVLPGSIELVESGSISAGIVDLTALGDMVGFVVEAGAFSEVGEILLGAGVSIAMIDYLVDMFDDLVPVQVIADPANGGHCTGSGLYMTGSSVEISATAEEDWRFIRWNDGITNRTRTVTAPGTYTATFKELVEVEGEAEPPIAGYIVGNGTYLEGTIVPLTAFTYPGWRFTGWFLENDSTNTCLTNFTTVLVAAYPLTPPLKYKAHFVQTILVTGLANPTNAGSVAGSGVYDLDDTNITLTATASNNWVFINWNDGTTNNPYTIPPITVTNIASITYTANFAATATITVNANPNNGGSVNGGGTFLVGSTNLITAVASNGWAFVQWGDGTTNNPYSIVVTSNQNYTANFDPISTVTALVNPTNAGSVTGSGTYFVGSNAVLTATASNAWQFISWNDGTTNNPYLITVPATNITYTANFAATATITVEADPTNSGTVDGGGTFLVGSTNLITPVASNSWVFAHWNDGTTNNPYSIIVTSNRTYTATFEAAATVTTVAAQPAGGTTAGDGAYPIGSSATVAATASTNWLFLNWNGTVTNYMHTGNTNNPITLTVHSNITYTANFALLTTNGFVYFVMDTVPPQVEIIGYTGPANEPVYIPTNIDGMAVTIIASGAFSANTYTNVIVPGSITNIQAGAIVASIVEIVGATAALFIAADAIKDAGEIDLIDMGADVVADIIADLDDDPDLDSLKTVTVSADPEDGGYCTGSGMYEKDRELTITATANEGWKFTKWSDDIPGAERSVTVVEDAVYTAEFVKEVKVTVEANDEEGGTVTGGGDTFLPGDAVTLTATTNSGWRFDHWSDEAGGILSFENPYEFQAPDEDTTYTANFVEQVEIEAEADPTNGGFVIGAGTYDAGSPVTLIATTNSGWRFNGWFLDGLLTNNPVFITVASSSLEGLTYTAKFVQTITVTGLANPTNAGSVAGGAVYDIDETNITLTATPSNGWIFVRWSDGTTNNSYNITAPAANITYTANFAAMNPTNIATSVSGNTLTLAWPADHLGWILQAQTNDISAGNWFDLPGTIDTNSVVIPMDPANPAVFYRLRQP